MIKWIVQSNLNGLDKNFLKRQLEIQDVEYYFVELIPFSGEMKSDLNLEGKVFVYGSGVLSNIAKEKGWISFTENLDTDIVSKNYGNLMLNNDLIVDTIENLEIKEDKFFIRPVLDTKQFTGMVITKKDFIEWKEKIKTLNDQGEFCTLNIDDRLCISSVKEIYSEYRFFVVNNQVVTYSLYKRYGTLYKNDIVDKSVIDFVEQCIKIWTPNKAFVIDIADTPDGYKIIECNSINSAGFYNIDIGSFIYAINKLLKE